MNSVRIEQPLQKDAINGAHHDGRGKTRQIRLHLTPDLRLREKLTEKCPVGRVHVRKINSKPVGVPHSGNPDVENDLGQGLPTPNHVDEAPEHQANLVQWGTVTRQYVFLPPTQFLPKPVIYGPEQFLLPVEMRIDGALADTGLPRDIFDEGIRIPLSCEHVKGSLSNLIAGCRRQNAFGVSRTAGKVTDWSVNHLSLRAHALTMSPLSCDDSVNRTSFEMPAQLRRRPTNGVGQTKAVSRTLVSRPVTRSRVLFTHCVLEGYRPNWHTRTIVHLSIENTDHNKLMWQANVAHLGLETPFLQLAHNCLGRKSILFRRSHGSVGLVVNDPNGPAVP